MKIKKLVIFIVESGRSQKIIKVDQRSNLLPSDSVLTGYLIKSYTSAIKIIIVSFV
jgi:hypothetical protein